MNFTDLRKDFQDVVGDILKQAVRTVQRVTYEKILIASAVLGAGFGVSSLDLNINNIPYYQRNDDNFLNLRNYELNRLSHNMMLGMIAGSCLYGLGTITAREAGRRLRSPEKLRKNAYHEAGHALAEYLFFGTDNIKKVTILGGVGYGGFILWRKPRFVSNENKTTNFNNVVVSYAGNIGERINAGDINEYSGGWGGDLLDNTEIIEEMVVEASMSNLAPLNYRNKTLLSDENTKFRIVQEMERIANEAFEKAKQILLSNEEALVALAEALLEKETLYPQDIEKILGNFDLNYGATSQSGPKKIAYELD